MKNKHYYTGRNLKQNNSLRNANNNRNKLQKLRVKKNRLIGLLAFCITIFILNLIIIYQMINNIELSFEDVTELNVPAKTKFKFKNKINNYFNEHPMQRISFLLNEDSLLNYIYQNNKEIKSIKLVKVSPFFEKDKFEISFRKPLAVLKINQTSIYVDQNGISYDQNNFSEPDIKIIDKTGFNNKNNRIVSKELIEFSGKVIQIFKNNDYQIEYVSIPPDAVHQIEVKLAKKDFLIKLTMDNDPIEQIYSVIKVLNIIQNTNKKVKYLDGRVPGKVFYK